MSLGFVTKQPRTIPGAKGRRHSLHGCGADIAVGCLDPAKRLHIVLGTEILIPAQLLPLLVPQLTTLACGILATRLRAYRWTTLLRYL